MPNPEGEPTRRTFTFKRSFAPTIEPSDEDIEEPATYYEALSGRRDPHREFFIRARAIINLGATVIALAFPIGLVAAAIIAGADLQTIVVVGVGGAVVGLMFKSSFPRTPFG